MTRSKLRHLPVVDTGRLVGIVTDRDLRQAVFAPIVQERLGVGEDVVGDIAVREVMTWAVITVRPATDPEFLLVEEWRHCPAGAPVGHEGRATPRPSERRATECAFSSRSREGGRQGGLG